MPNAETSRHLSGLRAKMAARDAKPRDGKHNKAPTTIRYRVPQTVGGKCETREERLTRLGDRRARQRSGLVGLFPNTDRLACLRA